MPILPNVPQGILNTADELRVMLEQCEVEVTRLRKEAAADQIIIFLRLLDRTEELAAELEAAPIDVRAERTRLETVENKLRSKARLLARITRRGNHLAQARQELQPDATRWWWYLDEVVAVENRRMLIKSGVIAGIAVALIIAGIIVRRVFFPPDPIKVAVREHLFTAELLIRDDEDYAGALTELEAALALAPDDWNLQVWYGVLLNKVGERAEAADVAFAKARALLQDDITFYMSRGMMYYQIDETDRAMADGRAVLELDEKEPRGYWILSLGYESKDMIPEAIAAVTKAAALAQERGDRARGDFELIPIARSRQAMLLQIMPNLVITPMATP